MNTVQRFVGLIRTIVLAVFLGVFSSCEPEQLESPILVFLTPEAAQIDTNSTDRVFITIDSRTNSGQRLRLQIESVDVLYGVKPVFDSLFAFNRINYLFEYIVPAYPDLTESLLIFKLTNDVGDQIQIAKRLFVNKGASSLTEASGNVIYSTLSDKPSGFSFKELTPVYLADSLTKTIDIVDATPKSAETSGTLSRTWISRTNLLFVKFNGFNYAAADAITISNSYKSGIKLSRVTELRDSDILIVGVGDKPVGAIQIISVSDLNGIQDDKYVFSVKRLD